MTKQKKTETIETRISNIETKLKEIKTNLDSNDKELSSNNSNMNNSNKAVLGTSPRDHDTDGDGLPDGWEWLHGLDPRSAIGPDGPGGDPDGDGMTNLARFLAEAPDDAPVTFVASRGPAGGIRLRWLGKPGPKAQLEAASTADGLFTAVPAHGPPHSLTSGTQSFEPAAEDTMRFFRMRLL